AAINSPVSHQLVVGSIVKTYTKVAIKAVTQPNTLLYFLNSIRFIYSNSKSVILFAPKIINPMVNCYIFCLFVGMSSFLKKNKALFLRNSLWAIGVLFCLIAFHHPVLAQKPGKEKIEIQFPEDIKWKREKVKTESASIRHEVFTPRN